MSGKQQKAPAKAPPPRKTTAPPPRTTSPRPGGKQFGTGSTDQENHVHVPPELMPDIYGNEFMKTMLA